MPTNESPIVASAIINMMRKPYMVPLGKAIRQVAKLRGGGSALPGLVIEKIDPDFVRRSLAGLPHGVVVITGSNGKTTTTKMVVELLESQGLKVFTNRTGSNFSRGVAAALLGEVDSKGKLDADIAVLELDEAHGVHFARVIKPEYVLLLNVMRDQLDRFGEVDTIAKLLAKIASHATKGIVYNRDDPRLGSMKFSKHSNLAVASFGASTKLQSLFVSDDDLHNSSVSQKATLPAEDDSCLEDLHEQRAVLSFAGKKTTVNLKINGAYNVLNSVAAIALCRMIMKEQLKETAMLERLQTITPAFGRGESFTIGGQPLEIILVKNPAGFRLSLASFSIDNHQTMIAINDNYADGRDMSWLWDVDFTSLQTSGVATVSGIRAYDMALRLQYDEVPIAEVTTKLIPTLRQFIAQHPDSPKRIFCTYTAMLAIRREIGTITKVEAI